MKEFNPKLSAKVKSRKIRNDDIVRIAKGELKMMARRSCHRCHGTGYCGTLNDPKTGQSRKLLCACVHVVEKDAVTENEVTP